MKIKCPKCQHEFETNQLKPVRMAINKKCRLVIFPDEDDLTKIIEL